MEKLKLILTLPTKEDWELTSFKRLNFLSTNLAIRQIKHASLSSGSPKCSLEPTHFSGGRPLKETPSRLSSRTRQEQTFPLALKRTSIWLRTELCVYKSILRKHTGTSWPMFQTPKLSQTRHSR